MKSRLGNLLSSMFLLSACAGPAVDQPRQVAISDWRSIYPATKEKWNDREPAVDPDTARLPRDQMLPDSRAHIHKVFERILKRNGLSTNTAVLVISGCESPSAEANVLTRTIRLCRGLLSNIEYDDDIAFVLSHELGHIILGHSPFVRTMETDANGRLLRSVGVAVVVGGMFVPGVGGAIAPAAGRAIFPTADQQASLRLAALNRSEEFEADIVGVDLMANAGYDPRSAIGLLESLSAIVDGPVERARGITGQGGSANSADKLWQSFSQSRRGISPNSDLRTHPSVQRRIKMVEEYIAVHYQNLSGDRRVNFATSEERDRYLDARTIISKGGEPSGRSFNDANFNLFLASRALNTGNAKAAIAALERLPEGNDGLADRWARMAAIAFVYLNDKELAREYADKHFTSGEYRRRIVVGESDFFNDEGVVLPVAVLLASPHLAKRYPKSPCRDAHRFLGFEACTVDSQGAFRPWSGDDLRTYLQAGTLWQS